MNEILYESLLSLKQKHNGTYVFSDKEGNPYGDIKKSFKNSAKTCWNKKI